MWREKVKRERGEVEERGRRGGVKGVKEDVERVEEGQAVHIG